MLKLLSVLSLALLPSTAAVNFLRRIGGELDESHHRSLDEIHCKPNTAGYATTCKVDPDPFCTPHRSPEYCPADSSFPLLISRRTTRARNEPSVVMGDGHIFHLLEDKLKGYVYTTQILKLKAPKVLHCDSDYSDALVGGGFTPVPATGFVVRATHLHSGKGVYVLPDGFGGPELLSGIGKMTAGDIVAALDAVGASHIIIEEFVQGKNAPGTLPTEYKMHVIDGEVVSINIVYNRGDNDKCACWAEVDTDLNRLDKFGCFTPTGLTDDGLNIDSTDKCYDIDFETGRKKNYPMKGLDLCGDLPDKPCLDDLIAVAKIVGDAVGAYVRVDMFLDADGNPVVQEYTSNHMGGTRHCSAKLSDDGTCVNACLLGELWKATGSTIYGGRQADQSKREAFLKLVDAHGNNDQDLCDSTKGVEYPATGYTMTCSGVVPAPPSVPIDTDEPSVSPSVSSSPVVVKSDAPTVYESDSPSVRASAAPSISKSNSPTGVASDAPTVRESSSPSMKASVTPTTLKSSPPTVVKSDAPTVYESDSPSVRASVAPSISKSNSPTSVVSDAPTVHESSSPSMKASVTPTTLKSSPPTVVKSDAPTVHESDSPSVKASASPSISKSNPPTGVASDAPTVRESSSPSMTASVTPTVVESNVPTVRASDSPSAGVPSSAPVTSSPVTPAPTKAPPQIIPQCKGSRAVWWGDPHMITFDKVKFDCQVKGEVSMLKSGNAEIQGRFVEHWERNKVSLTKAIAVTDGSTKVQVNILEDFNKPKNDKYHDNGASTLGDKISPLTEYVKGCPLDLYVDGVQRKLSEGSGKDDDVVIFKKSADKMVIVFIDSTMTVELQVRQSGYWRCHLNVNLCIPDEASFKNKIVGALGTPDGNKKNEFINPDKSLWKGTGQLTSNRGQDAYDFCEQYCVETSGDSLFTYASYENHNMYRHCSAFDGAPDTCDDNPVIKAACTVNGVVDNECLAEGCSGDVEDATAGQKIEEELAKPRFKYILNTSGQDYPWHRDRSSRLANGPYNAGCRLATITDFQVNAAVAAKCKEASTKDNPSPWCWIGAETKKDNPGWKWESKIPFDYSNWAPGKGTNNGSRGAVITTGPTVASATGEWWDRKRSETRAAVYECPLDCTQCKDMSL